MSLETTTVIKGLVSTNPPGNDPISQGDDHLRLIKAVLKNQFAGFTEGIPITRKESEINAMLIAGAFGLGGPALAITETTMQAPDLATGFYFVNFQGLGYLPTNTAYWLINLDNATAGYGMRIFVELNAASLWIQVKTGAAWQAARLQWDNVNTPKQTVPLDQTAGAVLTKESFGLGMPVAAGASANLNNPPFGQAAVYGRWFGNSWVSQPPGLPANTVALFEWTPFNTQWGLQEFHAIDKALTYRRFYRLLIDGFTPWTLIPRGNGEVVNAQGYRVIDNIVDQWGVALAIPNDGSAVITLPLPTAETFNVVANSTRPLIGAGVGSIQPVALTGSTITLHYSSNSTEDSGFVHWRTVGRLT